MEVDLISLDMTQRLPFKLRPNLVKAAVARGIYFEVDTSQKNEYRNLILHALVALESLSQGISLPACMLEIP